ncbi:hypothetical protein ONZ51_g4998 [Trametes cubensis]|uniref:Transmembrane protein n=1 Tax=Trametes cubensis TaxID=1111947 RepID=A0AAD7TUT9_9APHY|nr:hypothetical protein ONZ51_g4998 [Trametes cubensis]
MASPLEGWVYVDDDDYRIQFSDDWGVTRSIQQAYDNTMHAVSSLEGATATFKFTGTAVSVYGAVGDVADYGWPSSSYAIDGQVYEMYDFVTAAGFSNVTQLRYQVPYFTVQDLPASEHTLVITNTNGTSPNTYWLDYIRFYPSINSTSGVPTSSGTGALSSQTSASVTNAQNTSSTSTSTSQNPDPGVNGRSSGSQSNGAVIGGAIGGVVAVSIVAMIAMFLYLRYRLRAHALSEENRSLGSRNALSPELYQSSGSSSSAMRFVGHVPTLADQPPLQEPLPDSARTLPSSPQPTFGTIRSPDRRKPRITRNLPSQNPHSPGAIVREQREQLFTAFTPATTSGRHKYI